MPNDITTLAIEIQSQEAERNLRTFNELLSLSSQTAQKMEKVSIEIDVTGALTQLNALRENYIACAKAAESMTFDMPQVASPEVDTTALDELKAFFAQSLEASKELRAEMANFNGELEKLEADSIKVSSAGGKSAGSMRGGAAVSREYAAALRELCAAQKEMEKAVAQADEAMKATVAADQDAAAVKKRLTQAQRELATVSAQLAATHSGMGGDIIGLSEKEEYLKNKVAELKNVYAEAKAAAEKFNQKLEASVEKADLASAKYKELKAKVEAMPQNPMGGASESVQTFAQKAKLAGTQLTKLARGFNSVAMLAGGAIPGVAGLGRAISMFGMVNPYVAAAALAIGACVAVYKEYDKVMQDTAVAAREMAAEQAKLANSFKKEAQERQSNLDRLAVLNSYENLYDVEKEESRRIVEKLTAAYKGLGIQYDALTGKVSNLAEITRQMSEQDRQSLLAKQDAAVEMARSAATTQLAESQRNSVGWFKNVMTMDYPGGRLPGRGKTAQQHADAWYDYINSAKDLEEQIKRVNEAILYLDKIRQRGGADAWFLDAKNFSEQLKKSREQLLEYQKQWKILKEMRDASGIGGGRSEKAISESLRAREAKLQAARNASKTPTEKYEENIAALERLYAKRQELAALDQKSEVVYGGKKITAAEALLDIETEITNRTRERLTYEKQLEALTAKIAAMRNTYALDDKGNVTRRRDSAEQAATRDQKIKELRAKIDTLLDSTPALRRNATGEDLLNWGRRFNPKTGKMDGDQKQAGWRGVLPDGKGGVMTEVSVGTQINGKEVQIPLIVPDSTEDDLKRIAQIANGELTEIPDDLMEKAVAFAQKRIAEGKSPFFNGDARDEHLRRVTTGDTVLRDLFKYQTERSGLQGEQLRFRDSRDAAKKQWEKGRSGFVYDKKGNIVREKSDAELAKVRQQEIAAAKEKVKRYSEGSIERYQAQAELDRLQQEDFKKRQEASFANLGFSQMQAHNNMVQGLDAKSSQALRLETRNFSKPDNAWKTIEKKQTQIYDAIAGFSPDIVSIAEAVRTMSDKLVTL